MSPFGQICSERTFSAERELESLRCKLEDATKKNDELRSQLARSERDIRALREDQKSTLASMSLLENNESKIISLLMKQIQSDIPSVSIQDFVKRLRLSHPAGTASIAHAKKHISMNTPDQNQDPLSLLISCMQEMSRDNGSWFWSGVFIEMCFFACAMLAVPAGWLRRSRLTKSWMETDGMSDWICFIRREMILLSLFSSSDILANVDFWSSLKARMSLSDLASWDLSSSFFFVASSNLQRKLSSSRSAEKVLSEQIWPNGDILLVI